MPFKGLTYNNLPKILLKLVNLNDFKHINYQYRQLGDYEVVTNNLIKALKKANFFTFWVLKIVI